MLLLFSSEWYKINTIDIHVSHASHLQRNVGKYCDVTLIVRHHMKSFILQKIPVTIYLDVYVSFLLMRMNVIQNIYGRSLNFLIIFAPRLSV